MKFNLARKYGFLWITLILFLGSAVGHWCFSWKAYQQEQQEHHQPVVFNEYFIETARDTFENWQSEFLQLIWQVAGLAFLFYVGSPQSKEEGERLEEKVDLLIRLMDPENGEKSIRKLDNKWPKK